MKRIILFSFLSVLLLAACAPAATSEESVVGDDGPSVTVYRSPT